MVNRIFTAFENLNKASKIVAKYGVLFAIFIAVVATGIFFYSGRDYYARVLSSQILTTSISVFSLSIISALFFDVIYKNYI